MRLILFLIIAILILPTVYPLKECQRVQEVKDIPCMILTSSKPSTCSTPIFIYNSSGGVIYEQTFTDYGTVCNATFNLTAKGVYIWNSTIESGIITVEADDEMVSIGVIIFLILINSVLFVVPFLIKFTDNEAHNMIIRRSILLTGLALLAFVTTIIITLADNSGLGITKELFFFQWVFVKGIYVGMILLIFSMFISFPKLMQEQKRKERMGEE